MSRTTAYIYGGDSGEFFVIEEVADAEEAGKIANFYRQIIEKRNRQRGKT